MPFKTPNKTSEYIRSFIKTDGLYSRIISYADEHYIPVLLPESAAVLKQIVSTAKPARILEIGTAIGFSSLVMLQNSEAKLYTVEISEERVNKAKEFMSEAGVSERATFFVGDAGEIVPMLSGKFDFIFMDGPKTRYIEYFPYLDKLLVKGGALVCDNVLINGWVSGEEEVSKKKSTIAVGIEKFLETLYSDERYSTCLIPVGDGMSWSVKERE